MWLNIFPGEQSPLLISFHGNSWLFSEVLDSSVNPFVNTQESV